MAMVSESAQLLSSLPPGAAKSNPNYRQILCAACIPFTPRVSCSTNCRFQSNMTSCSSGPSYLIDLCQANNWASGLGTFLFQSRALHFLMSSLHGENVTENIIAVPKLVPTLIR